MSVLSLVTLYCRCILITFLQNLLHLVGMCALINARPYLTRPVTLLTFNEIFYTQIILQKIYFKYLEKLLSLYSNNSKVCVIMSPENFSLFKLYKFVCTLKDLSRKDQRLIRLPCRAKNVIGFKEN